MGGWAPSKRREEGFADGDEPSEAVVERRRTADIEFITRVRTSRDRGELGILLMAVHRIRWKVVCIERRLKRLDDEGL